VCGDGPVLIRHLWVVHLSPSGLELTLCFDPGMVIEQVLHGLSRARVHHPSPCALQLGPCAETRAGSRWASAAGTRPAAAARCTPWLQLSIWMACCTPAGLPGALAQLDVLHRSSHPAAPHSIHLATRVHLSLMLPLAREVLPLAREGRCRPQAHSRMPIHTKVRPTSSSRRLQPLACCCRPSAEMRPVMARAVALAAGTTNPRSTLLRESR